VVQETVQCTDAALIVMPGDDVIDPNLITHSTVPCQPLINCGATSMKEVENIVNALQFVANICLKTAYNPLPPPTPRVGLYTGKWVVGNSMSLWDWGQWEYSKSLLPTPYSPTPPVFCFIALIT